MGRGLFGVRMLACLVLAASVIGLGACEPLYGGKPEKLRNPEKRKKPPEPPDTTTDFKDIEDCQAEFRGDPKLVRPNTGVSNQLVGEGDSAVANSAKAKDPTGQASLLKDGIDKYRNALIKDPYNHEATLKLAVAYDRVYRKGCALALLKRLAALASNPRWSRDATRDIDAVSDNTQWFKRYRKDALAAVGR